MKLLFHILLLFSVALTAAAQPAKRDSIKVDTVKNKYLPTGLRIGTDIAALVKDRLQDNFTGWELNGDIDLNRYYLAFDYGQWGRTFIADSTPRAFDSVHYVNDGKYWRAGVDVNFLTMDPERNMFFIGMRYGRSTFSEAMFVRSYDQVWGHFSGTYANEQVKAWWMELTTGIRVKIWKVFWLGYTVRYKFALHTSGDSQIMPHDVPGYGRTDKESYWGVNYQLFIRLPVRKQPVPQAQK